MLAGNLASIGVGGIVAVVWSLIVRPLFGPVPYFSCIDPFFFSCSTPKTLISR